MTSSVDSAWLALDESVGPAAELLLTGVEEIGAKTRFVVVVVVVGVVALGVALDAVVAPG
jgi:hypothetical protein